MTDDALSERLFAIFVEELEEQLRELNEGLLKLERAPGDVAHLGVVFRVMHTLKGAARAVGLAQVEDVCHALEGELASARDAGIALGGAQLAVMFEASDALADLRDRLRRGARGTTEQLQAVLRHARDPRPDVTARSAAPVQQPAPPPAPAAAPVAPAAAVVADLPRESAVRVSLGQVEAIAGAAGEIAGLVGILQDRAEHAAALRVQFRQQREGDAGAGGPVDAERALTMLMRQLREDARSLAAVSGRLGVSARRLRQRPVRDITEGLPRIARDVASTLGRQVQLLVSGGDVEVDRVVLEAMRDPLVHLVRNAVDHGTEAPDARIAKGKSPEGVVRVDAALHGDRLRIAISDDGPGVDLTAIEAALRRRGSPIPTDRDSLLRSIFDDGFTTSDVLTTVSGRGVGMGIVRTTVERLGGSVTVDSQPGRGTVFTLDLPVSVATMRVLLTSVGGAVVGIPTAAVVRVLRIASLDVRLVDGREMISVHGEVIPVRSLAAALGPPFAEGKRSSSVQAVIVEGARRRAAFVVDDLIDERELVLRPVEDAGAASAWTVGAALLSSGDVALVLNTSVLLHEEQGGAALALALPNDTRAPRILVADDSMTSRTLEASVLTAAGYDVLTASDGAEAWRIVSREPLSLVVSDVEMPHLDGFSLCERIRGDTRTERLPVILVTSLDSAEQRARGLAAGADAYITKSGFSQDTLLDTVRMLIGVTR